LGSPTTHPTFFGSAIVDAGPGNRGLDFNSDTDFVNTGAIGTTDHYSNLFVGILHVSPENAGTWMFRGNGDDDRTGIWIDLNQNGTFESTTTGLGSNRGEQVSWESSSQFNLNLAAGDYLVAFVHREVTGGSGIDFRFRAPTMPVERPIRPIDGDQFGLFSSFQSGVPIPANNSVFKSGAGTVTLSGANSYNGKTTVYGGSLIAANSTALGSSHVEVYDNAALGLTNNVTLANQVTADGTGGTANPGAIYNVSGNNTITGAVTAGYADQGQIGIGSSAGTLTLTGPLDLQFSQLVADGAGNVVINGNITGTGGPAFATNVLAHYGYHRNSDGTTLDLNNNGGMINGTPSSTSSAARS
jgi:autotransporter-associated beta strand protein